MVGVMRVGIDTIEAWPALVAEDVKSHDGRIEGGSIAPNWNPKFDMAHMLRQVHVSAEVFLRFSDACPCPLNFDMPIDSLLDKCPPGFRYQCEI